MSTTKPRPGSMAEADHKSTRLFLIGAGIVIAIIMSMVYLNFPSTFLHTVYYARSGAVAHIASGVLFAACYYFIYTGWKASWGEKSGGSYGLIAVVLLALAIATSAGFNFSL